MKTSTRQLIRQLPWLKLLLILSIISLALQITGPSFIRWWQLPRPGTVGIGYLTGEYFQDNPQSILAPGYVGYLPKRYPQTQIWPLVVYLHGAGRRGNDPQTLLDWGEFMSSPGSTKVPAVMLLPQCRKRASWQPEEVAGFVEFACRKYKIDRKRIYLIGYSLGGYGTWATAPAYPNLFAAIVPIAGGGNTEMAEVLSNIPTWAFHGANDKIIQSARRQNLSMRFERQVAIQN